MRVYFTTLHKQKTKGTAGTNDTYATFHCQVGTVMFLTSSGKQNMHQQKQKKGCERSINSASHATKRQEFNTPIFLVTCWRLLVSNIRVG